MAVGPNVILQEEESDYVIVGGNVIDDGRGAGYGGRLDDLLIHGDDDDDDDDDDDGWDEVLYDHDQYGGMSSLSQSCTTSVATNVTLKDLNLVVEVGSPVEGASASGEAASSSSTMSTRTRAI